MAKQSLFAAKQEAPTTTATTTAKTAPATGLAVPMMGSSMSTVKLPEEQSYSNYVAQLYSGKGKWDDVKQKLKGLENGDMVLFSDDEPVILSPFTFWLLDCHQYWCVLDGEHKPRKAWLQQPEDESYQGSRVKEFLAAAIFVQAGDRVAPATFRCHDSMTKGVYKALTTATQDNQAWADWLKLSADHATTAPLQPNLRFKTTLGWRPKKGYSCYTYYVSSADIKPTSVGDASLINRHNNDAAFMEKVQLMEEAFAEHKQMIAKLAE